MSSSSNCRLFKSANLGGLERLQSVGDFFMAEYSSLESIDTTPMKALQTVGNDFFAGCSKLKSANLGGLERLQSVGRRFMAK